MSIRSLDVSVAVKHLERMAALIVYFLGIHIAQALAGRKLDGTSNFKIIDVDYRSKRRLAQCMAHVEIFTTQTETQRMWVPCDEVAVVDEVRRFANEKQLVRLKTLCGKAN